MTPLECRHPMALLLADQIPHYLCSFCNRAIEQLRLHLDQFVAAYILARRLKTLKGLTPYEFACKIWTKEPHRFRLTPTHQTPGPNTLLDSSSGGATRFSPAFVSAPACDGEGMDEATAADPA